MERSLQQSPAKHRFPSMAPCPFCKIHLHTTSICAVYGTSTMPASATTDTTGLSGSPGGLEGTARDGMDSGDSFPAIARAKKRFLERQRSLTRRTEGTTPTLSDGVVECMARLTARLDGDLALMSDDVERIHDSVTRDYARVVSSVDVFTSQLLSGYGRIESKRGRELGVKMLKPRGTSVLVVVKPRRELRVRSALNARPSYADAQSSSVPAGLSRATRLAKEAVSAATIQRVARGFLYSMLYTGGLEQLVQARKLRIRFQLRFWLRRWRIFLSQGRRTRRRLMRREEKIEEEMASRCRLEARGVMETDGKYGLAKEFHRLRLMASVMQAWIHAVTCEGEVCCSVNSEE